MREQRDLVRAYQTLFGARKEAILATVVRTRGSTYRKPGARMLMSEDAWLAGAISGGCLERDLLRKAWWRTAESQAVIVTYDGRRSGEDEPDEPHPDASVRWGFGLGCDGSIDVLLERVRPTMACHPIALLGRCIDERRRAVLSTVIAVGNDHDGARVGQRIALLEGEDPVSTLPATCSSTLVSEIIEHARGALAEGATAISRHGDGAGAIEMVHEIVLPPSPIVVFGGNYDAVPVTELAHGLGWDVTLVERRASASTQSRFAAVDRRVVGRAPAIVSTLGLDARTAAVVMTHDYDEDRAILGALLESPVSYIGMLGPRRRADRMLGELSAAGFSVDEALSRIHAPIGLDLGGRSPEEIALAIVAEVQASFAHRSACSLRETAAMNPRSPLDAIALA